MLSTLHIEPSGVPIYVQIRDQVLRAIGAGLIAPGERMPTMRQAAAALRVDLNTVRHAYDALARAGAVTIRPARGTFVADRPPPPSPPDHAERLDDIARRAITSARAGGIEPIELARRIAALSGHREENPWAI